MMGSSSNNNYYYKHDKHYDDFCQWLSQHGGTLGAFLSKHFFQKVSVNAPVLMSFIFLCSGMEIFRACILASSSSSSFLWNTFGVHDRLSWHPLALLTWFTHVCVHENFAHYKGNMIHLLLVGPSVEHTFGSRNLSILILVVALSSAWAHILVSERNSHQIGASGVVFCAILLNSLCSMKENNNSDESDDPHRGRLPLAFVITAVLWLGDELWDFFFARDHVSHHAHLVGGTVGALAGLYIHRYTTSSTSQTKPSSKGLFSRWIGKVKTK